MTGRDHSGMVIIQEETTGSGFLVRICTDADLGDQDVDGRAFSDFFLKSPDPHCSHHIDDVVGYVVFDNEVQTKSVTRTDLRVIVGRCRYGEALDLAREGKSVFSRGIGQLCRCGWRSY